MENIIKDNEGKTWINIDYFIEQYNSNRKTLVMPNVSIMNIDKKKLIEKFTKITDMFSRKRSNVLLRAILIHSEKKRLRIIFSAQDFMRVF